MRRVLLAVLVMVGIASAQALLEAQTNARGDTDANKATAIVNVLRPEIRKGLSDLIKVNVPAGGVWTVNSIAVDASRRREGILKFTYMDITMMFFAVDRKLYLMREQTINPGPAQVAGMRRVFPHLMELDSSGAIVQAWNPEAFALAGSR